MLQKLLLLMKVSRPLSWPLVGLLLAVGVVISDAPVTPLVIASLAAVSVLLPLIVFGVNDVHDYKTDSINKRKRSIFYGGALEEKHRRFVSSSAIAATIALALLSILSRNYANLIATALAITVAWAYSEPPVRLKERPPLDSLSNGVLVWSVILMGYSYGAPLSSFPMTVYFASLGASAIHAIGAIMGYTADRKANVKTIATVFRKRLAAAFALAVTLTIVFASGIKSVILKMPVWYAVLSSLLLLVKDDERLARRLFSLGFLIALASIAIFVFQQFYK